MPPPAAKTQVGGTLKIGLDLSGRPRVTEMRPTPGSPMNLELDYGYSGKPLGFAG